MLGEVAPVAGADIHLVYSNERAPGRLASYSTRIPIFPASETPDLSSARLKITIAGHVPVDTIIAPVIANRLAEWSAGTGAMLLALKPALVKSEKVGGGLGCGAEVV